MLVRKFDISPGTVSAGVVSDFDHETRIVLKDGLL